MDTILLTLSIVSGQLIKISFGTGGLILLDVALISLCTLGLLQTRGQLSKPPLWIKAAFVFIGVALISLVLSPITLTSNEYLISISYTIRFSLYILFGWLVYSNAFPKLKKNIYKILAFSGFALAILALLQLMLLPDLRFLTQFGWDPHYFRAASTFLDPNFLGSYLVLTLILLASKTPWGRIRQTPGVFYILAAIIYLALLTTFSRSSYLAFLTAFLTLSVLKRSINFGLLTILLFLGLILGFLSYERLIAQPRNIDRGESAESRIGTWQMGWQIFQAHPILGVGFNVYRYAIREYNLGDEKFLKSHGSSTNDSSLLYVAATTGVLGLISYLIFLFTLVKACLKYRILSAALMGLIAQSFFANTLFYPPLLLWIILMAI